MKWREKNDGCIEIHQPEEEILEDNTTICEILNVVCEGGV